MLEVRNLACVLGNRRLFSRLEFSLSPGGFLQLQGPNGSGKTSLLRMICGLIEPEEGEICWEGANIRSLDEEYFSEITYIGHRPGVKDELTALENLRVSAGLSGVDLSRAEATNLLEKVGLGSRADLPARALSEGQRRRLGLARLGLCKTALWLLDEVMTSLDRSAMQLVRTWLEEHLAAGGMALVATHQELNLSASSFQRIELAS